MTVFGACPTQGGTAPQVITKWGKGSALRMFDIGTPPADAGTTHMSWKPTVGASLTETAVRNAVANLRAGDHIEVWHEADVKYNGQKLTAAQCAQVVTMKNELYDIVKRIRPDLKVVTTYAAWLFESNYPGSATDPGDAEYWSKVKADVVGIDCDAYQSTTKYPAFVIPTANVKDYIKRHGYAGWSVPEVIHPRLASDPDGTQRAAAITRWCELFDGQGAVYVTLYDYNYRPAQELIPGSPEYDAYRQWTGTIADPQPEPEPEPVDPCATVKAELATAMLAIDDLRTRNTALEARVQSLSSDLSACSTDLAKAKQTIQAAINEGIKAKRPGPTLSNVLKILRAYV